VVLKQSLSFSSDAVRAPQLKVSVRHNRLGAPSVRKTQANVAWDKNQYDDRSEVASYIWHNYPALFSEQDRLADRKVHTDAKAAATDSEPLRNAILAKWGVNGAPTIDQLLADGIAEFRVQAADLCLRMDFGSVQSTTFDNSVCSDPSPLPSASQDGGRGKWGIQCHRRYSRRTNEIQVVH
jgi:hypothetical protein